MKTGTRIAQKSMANGSVFVEHSMDLIYVCLTLHCKVLSSIGDLDK